MSPIRFLSNVLHGRSSGLIVDVGAAEGDFSAQLMAEHEGFHWLLIEPTPEACARLRKRFAEMANVTIAEMALGSEDTRAVLHCHADLTQNSLLTRAVGVGSSQVVEVATLDGLLARLPRLPVPVLIKVDTQGYDFQVIRGGLETIAHHQPVIQAEVITVPLYHGQCASGELHALLASLGYEIADVVMPHHQEEDGRLAFCDMVFAPSAQAADPDGSFACRDAMLLHGQIEVFAKAAQERLELVHRLDAECRRRLEVITELRARLGDSQ